MVDWDAYFTPAQLLAGLVFVIITASVFVKEKSFPFGGIVVAALGFTLLALPALESLTVGPSGLDVRIRTIVEERVEAATGEIRADVGRVVAAADRLAAHTEELYAQSHEDWERISALEAWADEVTASIRTAPVTPDVPELMVPVAPRGERDTSPPDVRRPLLELRERLGLETE